jgi:hypothetical protein
MKQDAVWDTHNVIRLAREAGFCHDINNGIYLCAPMHIEAFAKLVAAQATEHEREACAKACENIYTGEEACGDWPTPEMCASAIRARGETTSRG